MFCNHCGKEITDDSKFCNYCGKEITVKKPEEAKEKEEESGGCLVSVFKFFLIVCAIFAVFIIAFKLITNNDSESGVIDRIVERDITKSDYTVSTSEDLTAYSITIKPKTSFNYCTVEVKLYDKNGNVIYSDTMTKQDLNEGSSYTYTFNYGFVNALSGSRISYNVSGKCVG